MPITGGGKSPIRFVLALLTTSLLVATGSACHAKNSGPAASSTRQVTVNGSGQVQGAPDTLTVDVGIEFSAPDVTTAMNQTNERQKAVIAAVQNAGVDPKDISTTEVSLQPQYDGAGGTITAYRANNAIKVRIANWIRPHMYWASSPVPAATPPGSTPCITQSRTTRSC